MQSLRKAATLRKKINCAQQQFLCCVCLFYYWRVTTATITTINTTTTVTIASTTTTTARAKKFVFSVLWRRKKNTVFLLRYCTDPKWFVSLLCRISFHFAFHFFFLTRFVSWTVLCTDILNSVKFFRLTCMCFFFPLRFVWIGVLKKQQPNWTRQMWTVWQINFFVRLHMAFLNFCQLFSYVCVCFFLNSLCFWCKKKRNCPELKQKLYFHRKSVKSVSNIDNAKRIWCSY